MPMQSPRARGGAASPRIGRAAALNILITRPQEQAEALARILSAEGWTPVIHPLLTFAPVQDEIRIAGASALVFTSANGVRAIGPLRFDGPVYAVGTTTAAAARAKGFETVIDAGGDAAALVRLIVGRGESGPLLHLRGRHAAGGFATALAAAGVDLRESVVYEMRAADRLEDPARGLLATGRISLAPFYSPRTALIFSRILDPEARAGLAAAGAVAISEEAAKPLGELGFARVEIVAAPTGAAMLAAIRAHRR